MLTRGYLEKNPDVVEEIEKATLRFVVQALYDFRYEAKKIFEMETDLPADIGEDITREALDRIGFSKIYRRLYGKIDYKQARYVFHPHYTVKQALFVDSKAEKEDENTITIQLSQTSMEIRQVRRSYGGKVGFPGTLPNFLEIDGETYLTTTVFIKYYYEVEANTNINRLKKIIVVGLPNGVLQDLYNPHHGDTIWRAGRNAPKRGEAFRVRIDLPKLAKKAPWRVQEICLHPERGFEWRD